MHRCPAERCLLRNCCLVSPHNALYSSSERGSSLVMESDWWKTIQAPVKLQSNDWECLTVVYVIRDGSKLFGVSVVRKGAGKTPLNLK